MLFCGVTTTHVLMSVLTVPMVRYVDDIFGVCFAHQAAALRQYIVELTAMCGFAVEVSKTPMPAPVMTILGISVKFVRSARRGTHRMQLHAQLEQGKALNWKNVVDGIFEEGVISSKQAERLAGRLNFVCYAVAGASGYQPFHEAARKNMNARPPDSAPRPLKTEVFLDRLWLS